MHKDFDEWNFKKKNLNRKIIFSDFKEGEIWWCSLGLNIGSEQDGGGLNFERPVLIIRKFSSTTFLCLPITSKNKRGNYYYELDKNNTIILCQPRLLDSRRLIREIKKNSLNKNRFFEIVRYFKDLL